MATTSFVKKNRNIGIIGLVTLAILAAPLIAMQFTDEVQWNLFDFIVAGILLFGTGLLWEFSTRGLKDRRQKIIIGLVLLAALSFVWVELAVGIFD